jgi:hypothetical protein
VGSDLGSVHLQGEDRLAGLTAGITVDPSTGDVLHGRLGRRLYKSTDKGASFERCDGETIGGRCETGAALNVDPERPGRIACFMLDGKSARTLDGGKTWTPINDKSRGFDYVAVDWSDPKARRMFGVRHESGEIGLLSEDGATWKVLDKPWKAFGVFDFDTLVTFRGQGIERSTDGGATWSKVSDLVPTGPRRGRLQRRRLLADREGADLEQGQGRHLDRAGAAR